MSVTAAIVNFNGASFLKTCLDSLFSQTYSPLEIMVVDNGSTDESKRLLQQYGSQIQLIQMDSNLGFAGAANVAIRATQSDYLLLMNTDVILDPSFVETLVHFAEANPQGGSFTGKLRRFFQEGSPPVLDSTGHILLRSRWVINRGEGEVDQGQYEDPGEVFGVCGAAAFYRRGMLEDILMNQEYLDESFFLYLEDVDLDWRARLKGWKAYYVPAAGGCHQRGYAAIFQSRNAAVLRHCLKNRYLMILKNDRLEDLWTDALAVIPYELLRFGKFLISAPRSLWGYWDVIKLLPAILAKRQIIQGGVRVDRSERRRWLDRSQSSGRIRDRLGHFLRQPNHS